MTLKQVVNKLAKDQDVIAQILIVSAITEKMEAIMAANDLPENGVINPQAAKVAAKNILDMFNTPTKAKC